jgi:uncharacterized membrane protein
MRQFAIVVLLWFSTIGSALLAGLYLAFSAFIMTSLGRIDKSSGIAAMNAINLDIQRSLFMPIFVGSTLTAAILAVMAPIGWAEPSALPMLVGGVLYVAGMFVVTMVWNVPLNNALAAVDVSDVDATSVWARYLKEWTFWNHVRTVASIASAVLFILALQRAQSG